VSTMANAEIARPVEGQTVTSQFLATVAARPDGVALRWKDGEAFAEMTFAGYAERAVRVAAGLGVLGVGPGTRVAMLIGNRPEFHVADMAVLLAGATPISIYNSSSPEQIAFLAHHCRAEVIVVEHREYLDRVLAVRNRLPDLRHVAVVEDPDGGASEGVVRWDDLLDAAPLDLETAAHAARPDDLATVIYTSGTTGEPKGVMIDHANICWTVECLRRALRFSPDGFRLVSYLPMAHIAERMTSHYGAIRHGYEVTTCPDIRYLGLYLGQTRPELFFGVPRTFEKLHAGVRALLAADPDNEAAFDRALSVGMRAATARARDERLPADVAAEYEQADAEMLRPVRELLGLDAVRIAVTSAAPIPVEFLEFFRGLGLPLSEMYGMSETCGPITWEPERVRPGTVGPAVPGVELRLAPDGEVQCRGGNVFRGYLEDPVRTAEVLDSEGWLSTGDIGELDTAGYLRIVDRKKELIITAGGKNVSPANVEAALRAQTLIGQACAVGDGEDYVAALLVLDPDVAPAWAAAHGVDDPAIDRLATDPTVLAEIEREVADANERFAHAEQVRRWLLLPDEWLPDSEELTPTMKLKRRGIAAKYAQQISELFR
jgi:long-chain acyl-CoA synthetase